MNTVLKYILKRKKKVLVISQDQQLILEEISSYQTFDYFSSIEEDQSVSPSALKVKFSMNGVITNAICYQKLQN